MLISKQVEIINKAHRSKAIINGFGTGIGNCSIHKWHAFLSEYTATGFPLPMIGIQTAGCAKIRRSDDRHAPSTDYLIPGNMIIVPNTSESKWLVNGKVDIVCIIFENPGTYDRLNNLYNDYKTDITDGNFVGSFTNPFIYSICDHLINIFSDSKILPKTHINMLFSSIETYILNYLGNKNFPSNKPDNISHQVSYTIEKLSQEVKNKIHIEDIAKELKVSPSYLSRKFKDEIGVSPHDFLLSKRIEVAKKLLAETDLDITRIANESGFSNQSHLTRYFTKYLDLTPLKYRQHIKNKSII